MVLVLYSRMYQRFNGVRTLGWGTMEKRLIIVSLITAAGLAFASDKPTVYSLPAGDDAEGDRQERALLSPKFNIVHIPDLTKYVAPKPTAGGLPHTALGESGAQLNGYVLVLYVITTDGRVTEPHIAKTTDQRLNSVALRAMDEWRFTPATLSGVAVATTAAQEFNFKVEDAPTEFVTQVLEPTGGKIPRPKDWFYCEVHRGPVFDWIVSREDASGHRPYTTGVRIQTFTDVKQGTGKTAKQFILDFVFAKKKEATKIIKICDEKDQGLFTRICLETEEGKYHILYSLFWGSSGMDVAVVSVAGTTKELWDTYATTFDKMSGFELIDMKRFGK